MPSRLRTVPSSSWNIYDLRRNATHLYKIHQIPRQTPIILHQPLVSRFRVIFPLLGQILNGISVSGPPKIGERPYPRQFHPVEMTPVFEYFLGNQPPNQQCYHPRHVYHKHQLLNNPHLSVPTQSSNITCKYYITRENPKYIH